MTLQIRDSLTLDASGLTLTRDGFLVGEAKVSRAGNVQQYSGAELGLTGDDAGRMFGVYRDPDVVFDERSMLSLAGRPVTRGHPQAAVTADNWRELAIGQVGGVIRRDGEHVVAPMAIMDAAAAKEVAGGARALSAGYTVGLVRDEGTAPDGTSFQFRQTGELRFNHVAYLPDNNPRAGNTRIGDGAASWGAAPLTKSKQQEDSMSDALKTVVLGDKAAQVAVADAPIIEAFKADAAKALADAKATHDAAMAAKDADLAAKDAEIAKLKAAAVTDAQLDARVQARADLLSKVGKVAKDVATAGLSDAAIKRAVVIKVRGAAMADKSDAYIDAAFDLLDADKADPVADALIAGAPVTTDAAAARAKMIADMMSGKPAKEEA